MQEIKGKNVFVTGAASGIGRATAIEFARSGVAMLLLNDINRNGLQDTAALIEKFGCKVIQFPADISDFKAVKEMMEKALNEAGRIDILANIAGTALISPLENMEMDEWVKVLGIDLYGVLHTVHCLYPHMKKRGSGHIVNIASVAGLLALHPYNAPYYVSKFGVVGFSEALMLEGYPNGINVTCICPGGVKTAIYDTSPIKGFTEEARTKTKSILLSAFCEEPEDKAKTIINAVLKNKFLVVTTTPAKIIYFIKRHCSVIWYPLMRMLARKFTKDFDQYRVS